MTNMKIYYDSLDTKYKSITGAVPDDQAVKFYIETDTPTQFMIAKDGEKYKTLSMEKVEGGYSITLKDMPCGLYFYTFKVGDKYVGKDKDYKSKLYSTIRPYQLTVHQVGFSTPEFIKGGVIYQIFPDRFNKKGDFKDKSELRVLHKNWSDIPMFLPNEKGEVLNNDFFGGNLDGITEKLPYLKELGVTVIYLNPIFKAYSNHRYDTGDYMTIDPMLGTEEDLINLINKANEIGVKIILDGVFNHTGADSLYFNKYGRYETVGAYQSKNSPYYKWFNFINYPNEYESWWGIKTLPQVNESNKEYIKYITGKNGVIDKYIRLGVYGFRLDVVDELPDEFVKHLRKAVKNANKKAILIGEVWEDASNKIAYSKRREYFLGKELDSVMNYPVKDAIIDYVIFGNSKRLKYVLKEQIDHYPKCVLDCLMNLLGTHDTIRIKSALSRKNIQGKSKLEQSKITLNEKESKLAEEKVKMASLIEYTVYGVPTIYYGDEIGMEGYVDPLNRRTFDWERKSELQQHYRKLGEIRKKVDCFIDGNLEIVKEENGFIAYKRKNAKSEALIVVNNSNREYFLSFDGDAYELLTGKKYKGKNLIEKGFIGIFYGENV